jgi:hypothetical protein
MRGFISSQRDRVPTPGMCSTADESKANHISRIIVGELLQRSGDGQLVVSERRLLGIGTSAHEP